MVARRLVTDQQLIRDVSRTLRERRNVAALTPDVLAQLSSITDSDVRAGMRYWERANAGTGVADLLRAKPEDGGGL